jgi:cell pole-organizing protein PopZ
MRRTLLLASLLLGCASAACAGQIYKWVDAQGITHFTAQPPQAGQAALVPPAKQPPSPPAVATPATQAQDSDPTQADIDARVRKEVAAKEKERADYCVNVRTTLAQLRNNPRLRMEVNGEMRRVSEDERQAKIAETEKAIGEHCQ